MSQTTPSLGALETACRAWSDFLGEENVLRSSDILHRYGRTTLSTAPAPAAILLPQNIEHVAAAVRIASTYKVPVYPISRGKIGAGETLVRPPRDRWYST